MRQTFILFLCTTAFSGMRPLGGPSSSLRYGVSHPLSSHTCSSHWYSSLMCSGTNYSGTRFWSFSGWLFSDHFYSAVHAFMLWLNSALKSGPSIIKAAQMGELENWMSPNSGMHTPPSSLISVSRSRSNPSNMLSMTKTLTVTGSPLLTLNLMLLTPRLLRAFPLAISMYIFCPFHQWVTESSPNVLKQYVLSHWCIP